MKRLYHFTSHVHLPFIKAQGITKGRLPLDFKVMPVPQADGTIVSEEVPTFWKPVQWLTEADGWDQIWCDPKDTELPYRNDEYRLHVEFAEPVLKDLVKYSDVAEKHNFGSRHFLERTGESKFWWLYFGKIPYSWVIEVSKNPRPINLTHLADNERLRIRNYDTQASE